MTHTQQYIRSFADYLNIDHNLRSFIILISSLVLMHFVTLSDIVNQLIFFNMLGMSAAEWTPYLDNIKDIVTVITALGGFAILIYNTFFKKKNIQDGDDTTGKKA